MENKYKYISPETKEQLKILKKYKLKILNYSKEQARQALIKTGIYNKDGSLKKEYKEI